MTRQGDKQFTVSAYILTDEEQPRILLILHKKFGKWMQPGGHIERNENPTEAIVREVMEESGVDIGKHLSGSGPDAKGIQRLLTPDFIEQQSIPAHGTEPDHFHLDLGYVLTVSPSVLRPGRNESQEIGWFTEEQVHKLDMFDNVRRTVTEALRRK